ncbi:MAG TPA: hypothetical protein VJ746_02115 [Nitrospira sp.]|nr:hypothetical protein [Nitrospira sp.]
MMQKEPDSKSGWQIAAVLIVSVLGGYVLTQSPLKSFRPHEPSLDILHSNIEQKVPARLWQDPLEAVLHYKSNGHSSPTLLEDVKGRIREISGTAGSSTIKLTMLIGTLDDSPYSEGRETRIRTRYAVGSALDQVCYVPESSETIGYMVIPIEKLDARGNRLTNGHQPTPLLVPFEWYRKRRVMTCEHIEQYPDRVLVLWVNKSEIDTAPLHYLGKLVTHLVSAPSSGRPSTVAIKLLGPWGSDLFRVMLRETMNESDSISWSGSKVELLTPWATVAPELIMASEDNFWLRKDTPYSAEATIGMYLKTKGVDWAYSIISDRYVLAELAEELFRRDVDIGTSNIALISEWDTFYGRMLPLEFRAIGWCRQAYTSYCATNDQWKKALEASRNADQGQQTIRHFTYLRGLDGESTDKEQRQDQNHKITMTSSGTADKGEETISKLERPDGPSQYDYLRRLSAQLRTGETKERPYRAIGILGSDPHDKLLILQALRSEFPDAIFFTTDLDARLGHPSQQGWARNLLIASPFGLRLLKEIQKDIPPFRDSYQTATYHALVESMRFSDVSGATGHVNFKGHFPIQPLAGCLKKECVRLFEVGRTKFVDLSTAPQSPHPEERNHRGPQNPGETLGLAFAGLFLAFSLTYWPSRKLAFFIGLFGLCLLTGLGLSWHWASEPTGEPFLWTEGVSIWPTELMRLLAIIVASVLTGMTVVALRKNELEIANQFLSVRGNPNGPFLLESLWKDYCKSITGGKLTSRVGLGIVAAGSLIGLFFLSLGLLYPPARDSVSRRVDLVILILSIGTLYILLVLVCYLTISCSKFISSLHRHRANLSTNWTETRMTPPGLPQDVASNWLVIRLTAYHTAVFKTFTTYPLYVLFLVIVSRNRYFDYWTFPAQLVLAYTIMFALSTFCSMQLWSRGSKLRNDAIEDLHHARYVAHQQGHHEVAAQIKRIEKEIKNLKSGIYGSWVDQPIWNILLYPVGGITILNFLDFMASK